MSLFHDFCKFLNKMENGTRFSRKGMKWYFNDPVGYPTTLDQYRRMVEVAGFIQKTTTRGMYQKVCDIPVELMVKNRMREKAYPNSNKWKELEKFRREIRMKRAEELELIW